MLCATSDNLVRTEQSCQHPFYPQVLRSLWNVGKIVGMELLDNPDARRRLAECLEEARLTRGLSYGKVAGLLQVLMGGYAPTDVGVGKYHKPDDIPNRPDLYLVGALVDLYGLAAEDVPPETVEAFRGMRDLVKRQLRCFSAAA